MRFRRPAFSASAIAAVVFTVTAACGSASSGEPSEAATAPAGAAGLTAVEVLQKATEASATLNSFRFTTETVVTMGDLADSGTVTGEWSKPGRYRAASDDPDDPVAEFIVADGRLIYRERGSGVWRQGAEFDPGSGIGSGQLIPRMDSFDFSDPEAPDDGKLYRITGSETLAISGIAKPIVQQHEVAVRVSDFHVEHVISVILPDPEIGLEGTRRAFVVFDRNVPGPIEIPSAILPPAN